MHRSESDATRIVRAWLEEGSTDLSPRVHDVVLREFPGITQDGAVGPRWLRMAVFAAVASAAAVVLAVVGLRLLPPVVPIVPGGSDPTPPPVPSAAPTPYSTAGAWYRDVGYIGLPPEDATPSGSGPGVLIGQYSISPEPPYIGSAFLYADGRLVWNEHTQEWSTGWLEQRLTTEGMDLAQELVTETTAFACCPEGQWMVLDPRQLPDVLPSSAWADKTVRPYVASAFAACVGGDKLGVYPFQQAEVTLEEMLALLPSGARDMLTGRPEVVPEDGTELPSCFEMSTAEARLLDAVFRDAHWEQDERMNRLILEYHTDFSRDPADWRLWVYFAQILPHGVVGAAIGG